jgi:hypothetical protein
MLDAHQQLVILAHECCSGGLYLEKDGQRLPIDNRLLVLELRQTLAPSIRRYPSRRNKHHHISKVFL